MGFHVHCDFSLQADQLSSRTVRLNPARASKYALTLPVFWSKRFWEILAINPRSTSIAPVLFCAVAFQAVMEIFPLLLE
jgi:hypothetical protein